MQRAAVGEEHLDAAGLGPEAIAGQHGHGHQLGIATAVTLEDGGAVNDRNVRRRLVRAGLLRS
jgi:hypothetical protein